MRRGDIRTAVLAVLAEGPGHGYDVIQRLEDKTEGAWRPSPGSVYPTLQLLEDEGLANSAERDGKRVYELTDAGRAETERRIEAAGGTPWELDGKDDTNVGQLRDNLQQLHVATRQIAATGRSDQIERAAAIVRDARKQLYGMLAED
jgi:DNA-binding PadR family transcriptional regulator